LHLIRLMFLQSSQVFEITCSIPDDYIDKRRFPLFFARDVLQALVAELKAENTVAGWGFSSRPAGSFRSPIRRAP